MARASGVDFHVSGASIPLSPAVRQALHVKGAMRTVLTGGDDYQIVFTIPSSQVTAFMRAAQDQDVLVTAIGTTSKGEGRVHVDGPPGAEIVSGKTSYSHF
jgi:thiamine-monophosphate kinase